MVFHSALRYLILSIASLRGRCSFRPFWCSSKDELLYHMAWQRPGQRLIRSGTWRCPAHTVTILLWNAHAERTLPGQKEETEKPIFPFSPGLRRADRHTRLLLLSRF